ncbi:MAG: hypothetical protein LQ343_005932 [Gyalolechia ehrenbergii]|nr:MAG: hypothetical protein LQ343_005932 [Gyalolechia ehrenbergii]
MHKANAHGMATLVYSGWLFKIEKSGKQQRYGRGLSWAYWHLFDFNNVEMQALGSAATNIVLVVVIGVLNLPVYVPALGSSLRVPYNMDHEFIGQGAANLLAGFAGTVPNILQLSYSLFFTRAGGGRAEAAVVTGLTFGFFFVSSSVLPYVPTVLASTLVLFLGIELTLEAVWESAKSLVPAEWLVVMSTLIACTFLGFAPGFGVGLAAAAGIYLLFGIVDTRARTTTLDEEIGCSETESLTASHSDAVEVSRLPPAVYVKSASTDIPEIDQGIELRERFQIKSSITKLLPPEANVFATLPSLESAFKVTKRLLGQHDCIIVDASQVHRLETSAVEVLEREYQEIDSSCPLIFIGISEDSAVYADLQRGGLPLTFAPRYLPRTSDGITKPEPVAFDNLDQALKWCSLHIQSVSATHPIVSHGPARADDGPYLNTEEEAIEAFCRLCSARDLLQTLFPVSPEEGEIRMPSKHNSLLEALESAGGRVRCYKQNQAIKIRAIGQATEKGTCEDFEAFASDPLAVLRPDGLLIN